MTRKEFEKLVDEGLAAIPERFRRKLDNVAIVIEDRPSRAQLRKMRLDRGSALLGLYEGIPQTRRGDHYYWVLPDKITIFRQPILELARDAEEIPKIVRDTVWHEIAHHFGLNHREIAKRERRRRGR